MNMNLYGSICLSDIPKDLIQVGTNGKTYLNVSVNQRREPGRYGHTHYIKVNPPKGATVPSGANLYIGDLKPSAFNNEQADAAPAAPWAVPPQASAQIFPEPPQAPSVSDSLPF